MAAGDIYQCKLHQTWGVGGQELLNVFYYKHNTGSGNAIVIGNLCDFYLLNKFKVMQATTIQYTGFEIINLNNPEDYHTQPPSVAGGTDNSGEALPPFVAWAFRFNRTTRAVRNGQKRLAGVSEGSQSNGNPNGLDITTALTEAADIMQTTLIDAPVENSFSPVIYRWEYVDKHNVTHPSAAFAVGSVVFTRITTQNTRKR